MVLGLWKLLVVCANLIVDPGVVSSGALNPSRLAVSSTLGRNLGVAVVVHLLL